MSHRDWNVHPPLIAPEYKSTGLRGPKQPLIPSAQLADLTLPAFSADSISDLDQDLTKNGCQGGEPLGERIVVSGKVLNENGQPVPNALIEIWQANSAGRYVHKLDQHDAPLDPNFFGGGRCIADSQGRYKFYSIKPGAYPWGNHENAWRPPHIHFSVFGRQFTSRLVTQMYFPGDPLLQHDPIFNAVPQSGRSLLISAFNLNLTEAGFALGYEFNIVLSGHHQTPFES